MEEAELDLLEAPNAQRMERMASRKENQAGELRAAMEEAVELKVSNAFPPETASVGEMSRERENDEDKGEEKVGSDTPIKSRFLRAVMQKKEEERLIREEQEKAERKRREVSAWERWNIVLGGVGKKLGKDFGVYNGKEREELGRKIGMKWRSLAAKGKGKEMIGESTSGERIDSGDGELKEKEDEIQAEV